MRVRRLEVPGVEYLHTKVLAQHLAAHSQAAEGVLAAQDGLLGKRLFLEKTF